MNFVGKKINFLGDSITEGVGTSAPAFRYVDRIKEMLSLAEARNYGVSGSRIARQIGLTVFEGSERDFCMRAEEMSLDADAVVVFGGTNDYGHGNAPLGKMSDRTVYSFYGALHVLMEMLAVRYVGKPVFIATPLHRGRDTDPSKHANCISKNETLIDFVNAIKEVAAYYGFPVIDLYATSGIQPNVPAVCAALCPDGLHPNDEGNRLLAERIANFILAY